MQSHEQISISFIGQVCSDTGSLSPAVIHTQSGQDSGHIQCSGYIHVHVWLINDDDEDDDDV